jgi:hypothetical protein
MVILTIDIGIIIATAGAAITDASTALDSNPPPGWALGPPRRSPLRGAFFVLTP